MATLWKEPRSLRPAWKAKNRALFFAGLLLCVAGVVSIAYGLFLKAAPTEPGFWNSQGVNVLFGFFAAAIFGLVAYENRRR